MVTSSRISHGEIYKTPRKIIEIIFEHFQEKQTWRYKLLLLIYPEMG